MISKLLLGSWYKQVALVVLISSSVIGLNLLLTSPVSALWENEIDQRYIVYKKSGNFLYYDGAAGAYSIINYTPQVTVDPEACDGSNAPRNIPFNSARVTFNNCKGLVVTGNGTWFEQAYYSFAPGDFDYEETIQVSGGTVSDWGVSTATHGAQYAKAKVGPTSAKCDNPNPNYEEKCSVLILFKNDTSGNFKITFDNETGGGRTSGHEFWYQSPLMKDYRTLTLDPAGGTVVDNGAQSGKIWAHASGANLLLEYAINSNATPPSPTRSGYTFAGWYDGGGRYVPNPTMSTDVTLYAHLSLIHISEPTRPY
jgi:uncharacterized repeat protein (TIGR02543 family)